MGEVYSTAYMAADLAMEMDATPAGLTTQNAIKLDRLCRDAACAALALKNKMLGHAEPKRGD